ncbi:hypothetical protein JVU11DRAFT_1231 [Chiua virens]|nr:hypothetical protein JVU11DRAFT_1231 [Chiua virens]
MKEQHCVDRADKELSEKWEEDHKADAELITISEYVAPTCPIMHYFSAVHALLNGSHLNALQPFWTFATLTTAFYIALKPSLQLTLVEAAIK